MKSGYIKNYLVQLNICYQINIEDKHLILLSLIYNNTNVNISIPY